MSAEEQAHVAQLKEFFMSVGKADNASNAEGLFKKYSTRIWEQLEKKCVSKIGGAPPPSPLSRPAPPFFCRGCLYVHCLTRDPLPVCMCVYGGGVPGTRVALRFTPR
jgi:hypothetical protein